MSAAKPIETPMAVPVADPRTRPRED
jgi:hypothetical protein